jgi:hypothetical protein
LPSVDRSALRSRRANGGHDPRRARRRPPILKLSRHGPLRRPGDITVKQSDQRRAPGRLSGQGPPALRWALYEAAQRARSPTSPDREYYLKTAEKIGRNRACLALARKLLKRSYHILRELGETALEPLPADSHRSTRGKPKINR